MRSAVQQAGNNVATGQNQNNQLFSSGQAIGGVLVPSLEQQFTHPQGFNPVDMSNMQTQAQQGAGGAASAIVGQGALHAARTGNSAAVPGLMDNAARAKTAASANSNLNLQTMNAKEKLNQQANAGKELAGLYGTDTGDAMKAMGLSNDAIKDEAMANNTGWMQNMTGILGDVAQGAGAYFGAKKG